MQISLNGAPHTLVGRTVADLLAQLSPPPPFAVAVNTVFVPRGRYADTALQEGDAVDVVHPVAGG